MKDPDTRFQVNDNVSVVGGAHNLKFGAELNRTSTTQTFVGFANGRSRPRLGSERTLNTLIR